MKLDKLNLFHKASLGGTTAAAIGASLCCIGPLIAVALGAGSFAAFARFERWRPLFLGFSFALLALAWYLTYQRPKARCEDDSDCATKPVSKWGRVALWCATGFVLIAATFPMVSSAVIQKSQPSAPPAVTNANTAILRLKIPGMDCAACAVGIQAVLRNHAGVRNARVIFDTKEAVVYCDAAKLSPEKIIAVIYQTGFKAELVSESKPKER